MAPKGKSKGEIPDTATVSAPEKRKKESRIMSASPKQSTSEKEDPSQGNIKSLFDNFFSSQRPFFSLSEKVWNPPADVYETSDSLVVKMEVAGVCQKTLEIIAENNFLIIRGCRGEDVPLDKENYHLMEIRYGHFERTFEMHTRLNPDKVNAQYCNGFLIVTIAKMKSKAKPIAVNVVEE